MKLKPITLVATAVGAAVAVGIGYGVAMWRMNAEMSAAVGAGASDSASAAADGRKPLYWHDPMVPGPKFDKPGKSPFMDMQLVPVFRDKSGDAGGGVDSGVSISPRAQQNLGVRTAEVVSGSLAAELQAVGSVAWNERDVAVVPARATGFIEKLHVRALLDPVAQGQPLVELYVPEWVAAQDEFLAVKRMGASNPGMAELVAATRQRMRLVGMTEEQVARVESRGVVQSRLTVTAPISGVLAELAVREGSAVTAGMMMLRINGLSSVWVNAEVPEALAAQVRVGQAVQARTPAGNSVQGKVGAVLPEINATTRTLKVRVELPNPQRQLVPGMFATLNFKPAVGAGGRADASAGTLLIPSEAVIVTGTRSVVMLAQDNGRFMPVEVEIGAEANGQTEIRKGLKAGQRVVLSGQFLVDSEASLKGVETRQSAASAPARNGAVPSATFRGEGKVEAIGNGTVTLDHAPIPEAKMSAMTMEYLAARPVIPRNVAVGDKVSFEFKKAADGQFELTSITPRADAPVVPKLNVTPAASGAKP